MNKAKTLIIKKTHKEGTQLCQVQSNPDQAWGEGLQLQGNHRYLEGQSLPLDNHQSKEA